MKIASALCNRYAPYIHTCLQEGYRSQWPAGRRCCRFLWSQRCCRASTRSRPLWKIWWRTQYFEQLCRLVVFTVLSQSVKPESSILTLVWWAYIVFIPTRHCPWSPSKDRGPLCHTRSAARAAKLPRHRDGSCRHRRRSAGRLQSQQEGVPAALPRASQSASHFELRFLLLIRFQLWLGSSSGATRLRGYIQTPYLRLLLVWQNQRTVSCMGGGTGGGGHQGTVPPSMW